MNSLAWKMLVFCEARPSLGALDEPNLFYGHEQKDKKTGGPKIWLYRDKATDTSKGEATITYEDPFTATSAIEWFNDKPFKVRDLSC